MGIFISRDGQQFGPYPVEQVRELLNQGILQANDLAWHEGLEGWISLGELKASEPGGPPPPIPAQPEPAIAAPPAKAGGNIKLFIGLGATLAVLAIAAGAWLLLAPKKEELAGSDPKPNAPSNQNPKAKAPIGKLTEPEAAELLAREIGRWKIAGKNIPVGADAPAPEPFEDILESRWLIEGKSLVSTFAPVDNGHKVQFVGYKNFDAKEGVFTWRSKGDGIPEMIKRERYDRQTKTFRWEFTFPDGAKETGTFQIADTDKRLFKSQVTVDGAVVFRREATFARIMDDPEPPNPVIAKLTPEEAAEVMALEIGTWESKGQGQPAGGQPNPITMTKEVRWKEEGKSLEYKFSLIENGPPVAYFGHQEYDAVMGVFVYRSKWGNNPETTSHEVHDITTGISRGVSVPTPANGEPSTTVLNKRVGDDQSEQTLETSLNGQLLYSHQITSTRINTAPTEPTVANPEPKDPNFDQIESPEALAKRTLDALSKNDFSALSKLGAESLPKEVLINTWANLRYAATEKNIKLTAQRRNITEEEAKEYLQEKIQKEKARMEEMYEKGIKEETADRRQSFDRVIAEGKKQANIDWGKVSFVRLEGEPFEKNGIKGGDFFIVLAYQGNNFKIKLDDCMHYPKHGWFLTHGPDWGDGTDDAGPPDETSEGESSHEEPAPPEPAPNAPAKGLVAYYPFYGNARNEAGNNHHGQVFGAKLTADRHGKVNSAYQFKPGDHIKIDGLMGKPKNLTLSAWVKLDGQQGRLGSEIISLGDIAVLRADNKSPYSQKTGTGGIFFGGEKFWIHTMAKANYTGTGWHQIVFTFDDEANAQVTYVDGKQMASKENPKSIVYEGGGTDTFIGVHGKTAKQNWRSQGVIDDLRVYDRALTTAEVEKLFRSEKPAFPLQAGNPIKITTITELRAEAQAGDPQAQFSMGLKFINGSDGLKKNPQVTEKLWLRASKQGHLIAQMNLGLLYSRDALGEKDSLKGYQWAKLSFQGGHQRAKQLAETLEKELTPEQIAEAEQFIKNFKPVVEQHGDIPAPNPSTKPESSDDEKIPGTVLWEFETGLSLVGVSSPAIGSDGTVYVGSGDNKLYAINGKTGVKSWEFETGPSLVGVNSSPAIGSDGTVYVGSGNKKLYAINGKTGVKLWEFKMGSHVRSSPAIGADGTVYVGSLDNKLFAINGKTGVKLWEFKTGDKVGASPSIGSDGTVYVGSMDNKLYAINDKTGVKLWEFKTGLSFFGVDSSPAIGPDDMLYVGSGDNKLYAINGKSGVKLWEFETGGGVHSSPAIGSDYTVYVGSMDNKLYAINGKTGIKLWEFKTGDKVVSSPAIGADGTVYVGSIDTKLHAINGKTGVKLWEFKTGADVGSSPAIGSDGTVYVGSVDDKLYAIKTDSKGLAKSPWPMRGQNPQHTGRAPKQ